MTVLAEQIAQIQHLTDLVNQQKAAVKAAADKLKPAFEQYIVDQTVPLEDRWNFWTAAPVELKKVGPWVEHFNFNGEEMCWFEGPVYKDRYTTVKMADVVEALIEELEWEPNKHPQEAIDALKEDVLARNMHSFENDW